MKININNVIKRTAVLGVCSLFILSAAAFSACDGLKSAIDNTLSGIGSGDGSTSDGTTDNTGDNTDNTDNTGDTSGSGTTAAPYMTIALTAYTLAHESEITLSAIASDGSAITWSSSDESVCEVSASGKVYAASIGEATITASSETAGSADCVITVLTKQAYGRQLLWNDEFEGSSLDTTKWGYMLGVQDSYGNSQGPWFWGNNEEQYYTEDAATVEDGNLVITATREDMDYGRSYSSARICTRDNFSFTYGYIEARIKSPAENGMWPAFWMLPQPSTTSSSNNVYGGWSTSGEIDIMEAKGRLQNQVDTTLHFSYYGEHNYRGSTTTLSSDIDEWHIYALEWTDSYIAWIIDEVEVYRVTSSQWHYMTEGSDAAPFDQPFYILINLAVGGTYDGYVSTDEDFTSASMYVDYVRVYEV